MDGISPLVSTVVIVAIVLGVATIIGPWMYHLATTVMNTTGTSAEQETECRNAGLSFDSDYGYYGVNWNSTTNVLLAKIVNSGLVDLHTFTFELTINSTQVEQYNPTSETQKTSADPLRAGESTILNASLPSLAGSTLNSVKIINTVCPKHAAGPISL